jgi:hypothetical protein
MKVFLCGIPELNTLKANHKKTLPEVHKTKQNKIRGLSQQANYTDRATAACRRS